MDDLTEDRAQLIESVKALTEGSWIELDRPVNYPQAKFNKASRHRRGDVFLLSIAGMGETDETDVPERDEEILTREADPIRDWSAR